MDSERWSERCDEGIQQGDSVFDDNVGSRFLTQKRAEQRGTWKVANKQSGAVEEKKKNLASHNENVPVWKVAIQDQEEANERV